MKLKNKRLCSPIYVTKIVIICLSYKLIEDIFKNNLGDKASKISVESLKNEETPAMILISEESRRMAEMSKMYA